MVGETAPGRVGDALRSARDTENAPDELKNPLIAVTAVLLLVLIPLLPFLAIVWSISRTLKGVRKRVSWE
jgi:multidrug efflux pump subunit AcrB